MRLGLRNRRHFMHGQSDCFPDYESEFHRRCRYWHAEFVGDFREYCWLLRCLLQPWCWPDLQR